MTTTPLPPPEQLSERLVASVTATLEVAAVELGRRLGWYAALDGAPATAGQLAERTGTDARYAREWLEQQAVAGVLTVDDPAAGPADRCYALPPGYRAVLVDELDPLYTAPLAWAAMAFVRNVPRLAEVYREGSGLGWAEMGSDAREAQAAANRPFFAGPLGSEVLPALPDVDAALRAGGRVADLGCGLGWSSIGIATAYPAARVDGFDVDAPSIERARAAAADAGVADRVGFTVVDAAGLGDRAGGYDLVTAFECVHDLPDPVGVLSAARRLVAPGGTVLVADEKVAETFTAPGGDVDRLMYGYSLTCCLPDGLSTRPSVGTGTVMRPDTLAGYARDAGFAGVDVLPVEHDFFRFYLLRAPGAGVPL